MSGKTDWTIERCGQLSKLGELVTTARMLNHSTNIVGNIERCEELATELSRFDGSFMRFLNDVAIEDRMRREPGDAATSNTLRTL